MLKYKYFREDFYIKQNKKFKIITLLFREPTLIKLLLILKSYFDFLVSSCPICSSKIQMTLYLVVYKADSIIAWIWPTQTIEYQLPLPITNKSLHKYFFTIMGVDHLRSTACLHYVVYNVWPVVYRKLSMSCFTMAGFVLHRLAMPWATDNSHQAQVPRCHPGIWW